MPSCSTERVRSHLPVVLTRGATELRGDTLDYDNVEPGRAAERASPRQLRRAAAGRAMTPSREAPPLVFITGASSGIGQALAQHYARAGWRLALVARRAAEAERLAAGAAASAPTAAQPMPPTCATPAASSPPPAPAWRRRACPTW